MAGQNRIATRGCFMAVASVLLVGLVIALVVWLFTKLPPAATALVAGGIGFLASKLYESWKESKERLYEKKREVYSRLLAPWFGVHLQMVKGVELTPESMAKDWGEQMVQAVFDAILYASDDVLKQYARLRESPPDEIMFNYPRLLKTVRKDLGYSFTSVTEPDILRLFINFKPGEIDAYRAKLASHRPAN